MMQYKDVAEQVSEYRRQIGDLREKIREAQASVEPEEVQDYTFTTPRGSVQLSALFNGKAHRPRLRKQ